MFHKQRDGTSARPLTRPGETPRVLIVLPSCVYGWSHNFSCPSSLTSTSGLSRRHFHSRTVNAPLRSFSLSNWSVAVTSDGRRNTVHLCFSQSSWSMSVWYNIAAHTFELDLKLAMAFRIVPRPPRRSIFSGAMPEHVYRPPTPLDASSTHGEPPRALAAGAGASFFAPAGRASDGLTGATPVEEQQPIARARARSDARNSFVTT